MIKKILCITMVMFMLASSSVLANENRAYTFEDESFSIEFSSDWAVITKDMPRDNPEHKSLDLDAFFDEQNGVVAFKQEGLRPNIKIMSWKNKESIEIENFSNNQNKHSSWETAFKKRLDNRTELIPMNEAYLGRYITQKAAFSIYDTEFKNNNIKTRTATTVVNGIFYSVAVSISYGEITPELSDTFNMAIEGLTFLVPKVSNDPKATPQKKEPAKSIEITVHKDFDIHKVKPNTTKVIGWALLSIGVGVTVAIIIKVSSLIKTEKREHKQKYPSSPDL